MAKTPQLTHQTLRVIEAILTAPDAAGADVVRSTGLATGTVYPILLRLEGAGWLTSKWEVDDPALLGRPRRRLYTVTAEGVRAARKAGAEIAGVVGRLAWV